MQTPQIGSSAQPTESTGTGAAIVVVAGGLDPSGGSGLVRDALTARARGARPIVVGTAWTQQGAGVHQVEARAPEALLAAMRHSLAAGPAAVKIGMVPGPAAAEALARALADFPGPVVIDPVLASSRGGALWGGTNEELFPLLRRATLITPNAREAEALTGLPVRDPEDAARAASALLDRGIRAVLIKGGHLGGPGDPVTDTLASGEGSRRFIHPRVPGGDVRGTGCALATALAVELGRGATLVAAIEAATAWLSHALGHAVDVGGGERHLP